MAKKHIEYKGEKALIIMKGAKDPVTGWQGELYVAVVQYGEHGDLKFDVIPDSTLPGDLDDLPEVQTFTNRGHAISHFMKLEQNKKKWK